MDKLKAKGLLENCLIVYVSDHGEMLGERYYRFNKYCLYEHSVRVPMILAGTAIPKNRKGTLDHRPAELVDVLPTIMAAASVPKVGGKPGLNLLGTAIRKASFCQFNDQAGTVSFMWRTLTNKLILTFPKPAITNGTAKQADVKAGEFYDLKADAKEWNNLYDKTAYRALRDTMCAELMEHLNDGALRKMLPAATTNP
jgi:arylsulfatase A-like enzyme